jgi:Zn-dependent protease with chaperone function
LGTPVAGVSVLGGPQAQAYALPVTGELWFSRRLLAICTDEEVSAIAAHEIGHLAESRFTVVGRVAASMVWWPLVFIPLAFAKFSLGGFFGLMLLCAGLSWLSRRMSHRLERRADGIAANAQGHEGVYASALEKSYRDNQMPAVNPKGQRTHPSLYDRLTDAGRIPDYPRPQPPRRMPLMTKLLFVVAIVALLYPPMRGASEERARQEVLDWVDRQ